MKGVAKGFFKTLAVAAILAMFAWTGTLLYWHFKLRSAVQTLERGARGSDARSAVAALKSGGCRSLSYVVHTLDRESGQLWQWEMLYTLVSTSTAFPDDEETGTIILFLEDCFVDREPTPAKYAAWCAHVLAWWKESGRRYHQWWRVWSSSCRDSKGMR